MAPTILIVGSTGNTGKAVVRTLPGLLKESGGTLSKHRVLAVTRSASSVTAREFAQLPGVEVEEVDWPEITPAWLQERSVERVFIASHNEPTQFAEEGTFLRSALAAGVKYVVRISTTAANVNPANRAYYPRTHWALEQMLSQPEYASMHWSSLQPNVFLPLVLGPAAAHITNFRKTGKQDTLKLMASRTVPNSPLHPDDVGTVAAHLLAQEDTSKYNHWKPVLHGPADFTGDDIVKWVEGYTGAKVEDVSFENVDFVDDMAAASPKSKAVLRTIQYAPETSWAGLTLASGTSPEVLGFLTERKTAEQVLKQLVASA
jgi:uncharacterized protein YbjT (DUF2867 family)